jgi:OOP family OmpA-OmpF porin
LSDEARASAERTPEHPLAELRDLIAGPAVRPVAEAVQRLEQDAAARLASTVRAAHARDEALAEATAPVVEHALALLARRSPAALAATLAPVMGASIRRAVSEYLASVVGTLEVALDRSLSPRGLAWRVEAWRTGRPFAEVVLAHTLLYRVEQLLLVHGHTGLVVRSVALPTVTSEDPALVSAMLTAIGDFARDSFHLGDGDALARFDVGDRTVWIEPHQGLVLGAVVRGSAPPELRDALRGVLSRVHALHPELGVVFAGDGEAYAAVEPVLAEALTTQLRPLEPSPGLRGVAVGLIAAAALAPLVWLAWPRAPRVQDVVPLLDARPGVTVLRADEAAVVVALDGAPESERAALAEVLRDRGLGHVPIEVLTTGVRLDVARARAALGVPGSVEVRLDGQRLVLSGRAPHAFVRRAEALAPVLAPAGVDLAALVDDDLALAQAALSTVDQATLRYAVGATTPLDPGPLFERLEALDRAAARAGQRVELTLEGSSDASGTVALNAALSAARAAGIRAQLEAQGLRATTIRVRARGPDAAVPPDEARAVRVRAALLPREDAP